MHLPGDRQVGEARIERQVRFWMRAYPRRWRAERGEELLGLVVDLAGPDATHVGLRGALDLVRGGWATRWREHPPLHTWLFYILGDRRIPVAYRSWAFDEINGFWYPIRRLLPLFAVMATMQIVYPGSYAPMTASNYGFLALMMVSTFLLYPEGNRSRARLKHVAPRPGEHPADGALVVWDLPRERLSARSILSWVAPLLGITGVASVVTASFAPKVLLFTNVVFTPWNPDMAGGFEMAVAPVGGRWVVAVAILVFTLGLGMLGAAVVRQRLDRLLGERPAQPFRAVRPIGAMGRARVVFWILIIAALVWFEVSGRLVLGLSVPLGAGALLLLPGALVALTVTRRSEVPDLAGTDVWRMAVLGRLPAVDRPGQGLRPLPPTHAPEVRNGAVPG